MNLTQNVDLRQYSTIKIGGVAKFFTEIETENDIYEIVKLSQKNKIPFLILGEGSNTFFNDGLINRIFGLMKIKGRLKTYENNDFVNLEIGAGENWDKIVEWTIKNNWTGIECLSGIPGTIGASPVQNIGAYGQEIKNVITHVKAYDTQNDQFLEIPNDQCLFGYRDSIFKKNPNRFIISSVSLQLKKVKENLSIPQYKDLQLYFLAKKQKHATLNEIRKAIIKIRSEKLPNTDAFFNCGSFFKNPIISNQVAENLIETFPKMPQFKIDDQRIKIFAGWLIEQAGFKGYEYKNLKIYDKNALIIINNGSSTARDLLELEKIINQKIEQVFGLKLEREPNFITTGEDAK
jgi:UDP-N-acetylmuramate dehydrogenase